MRSLILLATVLSAVAARTVYDEISSNPELSKFKEWIDRDDLLVLFLKRRSLTVLAPTNAAIEQFVSKNPQGLTASLANYHIAPVVIKREQFPFTTNSFEGKYAPLFFNTRPFSPSNQYTDSLRAQYINNAFVIESREDLRTTSNDQQVMYVIDEVLKAYEPTTGVPPNALEFISDPSIYGFTGVDLSNFVNYIREQKMESLFTQPGKNTFFIPSKPPLAGAPEVDQYVLKAHVIGKEAFAVRTLGERRKYNTLASDGKVDVELSLMNMTSRFSPEKVYYVQTDTVKTDSKHMMGKVWSRLTPLANIPVKNGIVHIIDKPLMLMDMSIKDFLQSQAKLSRFYKLLQKHGDVMAEINREKHKTILAPDDNAFENLINNNQNFSDIDETSEDIKKLLRQHVVFTSVSSSDLKKNNNFMTHQSAAKIPVSFRIIGSDTNVRLTVESGGVNATSIQSDFGASDGILHIIDRVLGMPFKALREKLLMEKDLKETFKIGSQGGNQAWNSQLADENKRFTFFAPSNEAWAVFARENPSEFKQLDTELYPPIARAILNRHLSARGQYNKKDLLQTVKKVDTIQGELIISPDPVTREIYVEWEGQKAKIVKSDIYGLNGVIHVIDQVLAKRRDFKVNAAVTVQQHGAMSIVVTVFALLISYMLR